MSPGNNFCFEELPRYCSDLLTVIPIDECTSIALTSYDPERGDGAAPIERKGS
jgi:hypothetical protein